VAAPRSGSPGAGGGSASGEGSRAFVYFISAVAATSGLLFGFDIAVINGAIVFLEKEWHLSELQTELAASSLLVGCIFGAAFGGWLSDLWGRRNALLLSAFLFAVSAIGASLPHGLPEFAVARVLGGLAIGVASVLAPLYIAEISPARIRGRLVAMNQMAIVSGILLSYLANWGLSFLGSGSWRYMFAVAAIPALVFFIALFFVPESPRWLMEKGRESEARQVLERATGVREATVAIDALKEVITEESGTFAELFKPGIRRALGLAIVLAIMQQWAGVNTVLFYGSKILSDQVGATSALGANVLIGLINFVCTIIALGLIDRLGRKALLVFSAAAMAISHVILALCFLRTNPPAALIVGAMLLCVAAFAVGLGPGVWVVLSEIFPTRIRGRAMAVATVALWVACTVLTMTFLTLSRTLGRTGAFLIYGGMCAFTALFVFFVVPETRGKTLEEIEKFWVVSPEKRSIR
jgi:MFS transporter, SP family, arabinose:H+ symporter